MWGSITDHGLLTGDRQRRRRSVQRRPSRALLFHAERLIHSLIGFTAAQRAALEADQGAGVVVLRRPQVIEALRMLHTNLGERAAKLQDARWDEDLRQADVWEAALGPPNDR